MKVAIVHYWLTGMRGGERVLERILALYPQADLFTHVFDPRSLSEPLRTARVRTTFIDRLPFARSRYQMYLPLMPLALEELDLQAYDLVISSEAGPAKGVIVRPDATHVCYCHSPMRYIWDQYPQYRRSAGALARLAMPAMAHRLRQWDVTAAARVDHFVANSAFVARRIDKYYRRGSAIVHPPVPVDRFAPATSAGDHFLWVGQLAPYKRADLAVEAFTRLGLPLVVVGKGPEGRALRRMAGPTVRFVEALDFAGLQQAYARARALVFTAREDFGIVPVEAMASGRPVLAFGGGGALETVVDGVTGLFFPEQTVEALIEGVERLERWLPAFDPAAATARAQHFSPQRFDEGFRAEVERALGAGRRPG